MNRISNMLDSGLRRNDGFGCFSDFFSNLLKKMKLITYFSRVRKSAALRTVDLFGALRYRSAHPTKIYFVMCG